MWKRTLTPLATECDATQTRENPTPPNSLTSFFLRKCRNKNHIFEKEYSKKSMFFQAAHFNNKESDD